MRRSGPPRCASSASTTPRPARRFPSTRAARPRRSTRKQRSTATRAPGAWSASATRCGWSRPRAPPRFCSRSCAPTGPPSAGRPAPPRPPACSTPPAPTGSTSTPTAGCRPPTTGSCWSSSRARSAARRAHFGDPYVATIDDPGAISCYTFAGANGDQIRARVIPTSGALNPVTEVLRPNGTTVCANDLRRRSDLRPRRRGNPHGARPRGRPATVRRSGPPRCASSASTTLGLSGDFLRPERRRPRAIDQQR